MIEPLPEPNLLEWVTAIREAETMEDACDMGSQMAMAISVHMQSQWARFMVELEALGPETHNEPPAPDERPSTVRD